MVDVVRSEAKPFTYSAFADKRRWSDQIDQLSLLSPILPNFTVTLHYNFFLFLHQPVAYHVTHWVPSILFAAFHYGFKLCFEDFLLFLGTSSENFYHVDAFVAICVIRN